MAPERMRCVRRQKTRIVRCALPVVILMAGAPAAAFSEALDCHSIRRGESAAQVARRITGDSRDAYQAWFQIRNASSRFVPKSQYNSIRAGWQACLLKPIVQRASAKVEDVVAPAVLSEPLAGASAPVAPVLLIRREPDDGSTRLQ